MKVSGLQALRNRISEKKIRKFMKFRTNHEKSGKIMWIAGCGVIYSC